jgi:hypothetical protein
VSLALIRLRAALLGLGPMLTWKARRDPEFRARLKEKDAIAQIRLLDNSAGRYYIIRNGRVTSRPGIHPSPDVSIVFANADVAARLVTPPVSRQAMIDAAKNFSLRAEGPDELAAWFSITMGHVLTSGLSPIRYGKDMGDRVRRYVSNTNGGPIFVYVRDGRILRITPIEFNEHDPEPWTIRARGREFTPPRKTTLPSYSFA